MAEDNRNKPGNREHYSDSSRTVQGGIHSLNNSLKVRKTAEKALYEPMGRLRTGVEKGARSVAGLMVDDDTKEAAEKLRENSAPGVWAVRTATHVLGTKATNSGVTNAIRQYERDAVHGDALEKIMTSDIAKNAGIKFDGSRMTVGDVKAFRTIEKTLDGRNFNDLSKSERDAFTNKILDVRSAANARLADGGVLNKNNRMGRRIQDAFRMNAGETYIRDVVNTKKVRSLLDKNGEVREDVKSILNSENSILYSRNAGDYQKRIHIVDSVLREKNLFGEFSEIDWSKLSEKDIQNILRGKFNWGQFFGGKKMNEEILKNAALLNVLAVRAGVSKAEAMRRVFLKDLRAGAKSALSFSILKTYSTGMDADTQRAMGEIGKVTNAGKLTVRVGYHEARFAGKTVRKAGSLVTTGVEKGLAATGQKGAAEAVKQVHTMAGKILDAPGKATEAAKKLPGRAVKGVASATGAAAGTGARFVDGVLTRHSGLYRNTKQGIRVLGGKFGDTKTALSKKFQPIKKFQRKIFAPIGKAANKAAAPFRFLGKVFKKFALAASGLITGIVLFVIVVCSIASMGGGGGGGGVVTIFLDSEEHLKDFQSEFDKLEGQFEQSINGIVNGYAQTLDLQGKKMKYGVQAEATLHPGVYYNFFDFAGNPTSVTSNIEDIMSCIAVVMQQSQQDHHEEALSLMDAYYHSSHQFNYSESAMYACSNGDKVTSADGTVLKNPDGTDKTEITFNCADAYKDDVDGLLCKPYFRLLEEPADSIFSNKFNNFNRNYEEFDKIISEKTGVDPVLGTKGCQKLSVPESDQASYEATETRTTKNTYYYYENKNGDERKSDIEIGYPESNPSINKSVKTRSYHNGGEGVLLLWNPVDYGDSTKYEDRNYESGACYHYYIDSTELSGITGHALMEYHENKDGDSTTTVVSMDDSGSQWFHKLKADLQDNAKLDGDYSGAPFDVSSLPSWLTDGSCVDKDGKSMIGAYPYKGFGETESKSGVTRYKSGLMGYVFYCKGHDHYECPGHKANICYGHVDLYMNVRIATMEELYNLGGVPVDEDGTVASTEDSTDSTEPTEENGGEENLNEEN